MGTAARAVARVWKSKDSVWSPEDRDSSAFAELWPLNTAFSFDFPPHLPCTAFLLIKALF